MDVARYGDWTTLAYTNAKVRENYSRRFRIRFPNEELPAARPLRTTPIYERLRGAARGVRRLLRARASAVVRPERRGGEGGRSPSVAPMPTPYVGAECQAVREGVGLLEISNYGKFEVTGPGTAEWLSHVMANRVPQPGRIALTPMLNERGKLIGDFTMCRRVGAARVPHLHLRRRSAITGAGSSASQPPAGRQRAPVCHGVRRPVGRRPAFARAAAEPGARRTCRAPPSRSCRSAAGRRHGAGAGRPHQLHRRTRLRNLGDERVSARALRPAAGRRARAAA